MTRALSVFAFYAVFFVALMTGANAKNCVNPRGLSAYQPVWPLEQCPSSIEGAQLCQLGFDAEDAQPILYVFSEKDGELCLTDTQPTTMEKLAAEGVKDLPPAAPYYGQPRFGQGMRGYPGYDGRQYGWYPMPGWGPMHGWRGHGWGMMGYPASPYGDYDDDDYRRGPPVYPYPFGSHRMPYPPYPYIDRDDDYDSPFWRRWGRNKNDRYDDWDNDD